MLRKTAAVAILLALAACQPGPTSATTTPAPAPTVPTTATGALTAVVTSSVGQSLVNALVNKLAPGVNTTIAKVTTGSAATVADLNNMAFALPWLQAAVDAFGSYVGMSTTDIAAIDAAVPTLVAQLQNPPANVGAVLADAAALWGKTIGTLAPALGA